jgi:transposase, IS30 family
MKQQRAYVRISDGELDRVSELQALGYGVSKIARELSRAKSSISELIALNKDHRDGVFRANLAARRRTERKLKQRKHVKLVMNERLLMELYIGMVYLRRSPEQIANRLKKEYPRDMSMHISSETIYEYIYIRAQGTLREDLIASLRRPQRHRGQHRRRTVLQGTLPNITSIDERPAGVLSRSTPGHWESDLIVGKDHKSALISLVERKFRYTILIRITALDAETFATKVTEVLNGLPQKLRRTMTHDNGKEIAKAFDIETKTGIRVYVAHPRSPWERGTNENTNGLVREFFPKGTDFRLVPDDEVMYVQELLNCRPRKTLDWATPSEVLLKTFG